MNQILQVKDTKLKSKSKILKKIILFFLITIITTIAIIGLGLYIYQNIRQYNIYQNFINIELPGLTDFLKDESTITLTQTDRNKLIISVSSEIGISKVTYSLNNEESQEIELIGETFIEETIEMPTGENTVYISVIDINEKETTKQENFVVEAPKPVIDLSVVGNNIKIIVTSEVELSEIKYKWNSENEKKENMHTYKDRMSFEKQLEIPIGENTLTVVAIDINGEKTEKVQVIRGVTKATTTTKVDGEYLHFTIVGKENIEKVEFVFNGQTYLMNKETFGETKKVHYKVQLVEGMNYLTVTSTTQSGGVDTTSYEQKYTK